MRKNERTRENLIFLFSGRWLPEVKTCFLEGIRLVRAFGESRDLVFSPSRSNLGLVSSRLAGFVRNREIYNLGMVSGPVLLKIKGKSWIFRKKWKSQPCFVTKSVRFGRTELLFFFPCSKSRDLGPEHGFRACSFKNKRKKLDFDIFGVNKNEKQKWQIRAKSVKCWSPEL